MPPTRKQQVVHLLKSLETKDPVPFAYVNPNKYIQHNLQVGPGPAGVAALIQNMPPDASVNTIRVFEDGDYVFAHTELKLAVAILPLITRGNRFKRIQMLGDLAVLNAEQIVDTSGCIPERGLGDDEDEVAFAEYLVHALVDHRLTFGCKSLQARNQPRDCIGDPGVVLNVPGSVEVARKGLATTCEKVLHVALHERLIGFGLIEIGGGGGTVNHRVSAGAGFDRGLLQVVPVLDDQAIFEAENVESDAWTKEVVLGVGEDTIAILKDANGIDGRIERHVLDEGGHARGTRSYL